MCLLLLNIVNFESNDIFNDIFPNQSFCNTNFFKMFFYLSM